MGQHRASGDDVQPLVEITLRMFKSIENRADVVKGGLPGELLAVDRHGGVAVQASLCRFYVIESAAVYDTGTVHRHEPVYVRGIDACGAQDCCPLAVIKKLADTFLENVGSSVADELKRDASR